MDNIALGRYLPLDSWMHRIDPRFKIVGMLLMLVSVFIPSGWVGYGLLVAVVIVALAISKIPISYIVKSFKPMLFMMTFLLVINILVIRTGRVLVDFGWFKVYSNALSQTAYIGIRLVLMIIVTTILTATTKPLDMTLGIEDLLKPLKRFGVPAHEIAMMISIALRFIPTLIDETTRIMKAQSSRGVDFQESGIKERVMGILSLIVPLFVSAFQRAEDLADAMEARGYSPGRSRTRYKQLKIMPHDYVFLTGCVVVLSAIIGLSVL